MNQVFNGSASIKSAFVNGWLIAACIAASSFLTAQDQDPSAMWYRAFLTYESTLELEKKGQYLEALNKCNEAKALYDGLAYNFPQFQPDIVKFKQKIVSDTKLRIKEGNRIKMAGGQPNFPPRPTDNTVGTSDPEFPNINVEPPYQGGGNRHTPIASSPEVRTQGGQVLPSWNHNPRVGRQANALLEQVSREEVRRDSIINELNRENRQLKAERDANQARLQTVQDQLSASRKKQDEYRRQLDAYERDPNNQNYRRKAEQYKALLEETMEELRESTNLNGKLIAQLRAARETIKLKDAQIKQLQSERESLAKIIQGKGIGSEALQDLMTQNQKLSERLELLEKVAQRTSSDNQQKEQDIALLKEEVAKVKVERDRLVTENVRHQQEIEGLQKKLEILSDGLSDDEKKSLANMAPEQRAENELLRSMVLKQLRRQAHMKQTKELLLRQLDRVGARSSVLMEVVEDMARGPQLSPAEKALFKSPQVAELIESASPMSREGTGDDVEYDWLLAPSGAGEDGVIKGQKVKVELAQLDKSARLDFQEGRYAEAEEGFLRYLHFRPRSVPCLCNLGILKIALKNFDEAQEYLQKAVAIDKSSGQAFYLLGRTYFLQEKYDEALSHLQQGIELQPDNAQAHNCVGVIACKKGWVARAERAFVKAISIEPRFGDAHFNLAVLFSTHGQGDFEKAKEHYLKARELGVPADASIENYLNHTAQLKGTPGVAATKSHVSLGLR
ncbi:MAG: tetratricopeptide repeat protein [Verrucomicrobiales bacterium]|nr:tetratricopeptide repeat protein [Verrucomicrobiales bacterium]